jgi:hypothetical protein
VENKMANFYVREKGEWKETENDYGKAEIIRISKFDGDYLAYGYTKNYPESYTMLCENKSYDNVLADAIRLFDSILS